MEGTPWQAYALIVHLAKRLNKKNFGKTKLQKIVYLADKLKRVRVGYDFNFYTYGPFSSDLAADLDYVESLGGVEIVHNQTVNRYEIRPSESADRLESKTEKFFSDNKSAIDEIVDRFGDKQAKDLELLSTIIYVTHSGFSDKDRIVQKTKDLKPRFNKEEIEDAYSQLNEWGYISS